MDEFFKEEESLVSSSSWDTAMTIIAVILILVALWFFAG